MPLYFAYGSNMDEATMLARCPKSRALGLARLARHRFTLMGNGYASVRRDPMSDVHGVLFDLALSDVAALDRYEDVAHGLYVKLIQAVLRADSGPCQALLYVGTDERVGRASIAGYMEGIVASARIAGLPKAYIAMLESHLSGAPTGRRGELKP